MCVKNSIDEFKVIIGQFMILQRDDVFVVECIVFAPAKPVIIY